MDLPIDTTKLHIIIGEPCAPRTDRETGQQRTDKMTGRPIFDTGLIVGDGESASPVRVKTFVKVNGGQMTPVTVKGLTLTMLVMSFRRQGPVLHGGSDHPGTTRRRRVGPGPGFGPGVVSEVVGVRLGRNGAR